ncbi:hypothetical protein BaRGS_00032152 [Batillaria attramentaria]|uniref:CUB domain-containing protein n=1 Tax=Batillaria attramentaria TaxID=370345 RepID=A0ABD0JP70_9CAEN
MHIDIYTDGPLHCAPPNGISKIQFDRHTNGRLVESLGRQADNLFALSLSVRQIMSEKDGFTNTPVMSCQELGARNRVESRSPWWRRGIVQRSHILVHVASLTDTVPLTVLSAGMSALLFLLALPVAQTCGGNYVITPSSPMTMTSPGYDAAGYPPGIQCVWTFKSADGQVSVAAL